LGPWSSEVRFVHLLLGLLVFLFDHIFKSF
jgi:hypothetical protein